MSETEAPTASSEMVERVARAMDDADCGYHIRLTSLTDEGSTYTLDLCDGSPLLTFGHSEDAREHADRHRSLARARAAISAMREPTPTMVEAGRWPAEDDGPVACWQAMIDAALAKATAA